MALIGYYINLVNIMNFMMKIKFRTPITIKRLFKKDLELDQTISAKILLNRIKNNINKPPEEREAIKYNFSEKLLPSLRSVSIYLFLLYTTYFFIIPWL